MRTVQQDVLYVDQKTAVNEITLTTISANESQLNT